MAGTPLDTPSPQGAPPKRAKPALDTTQKLDAMFSLLSDLDWSLGEFLHHLFAHKDDENSRISRSQRHGLIVQNFLGGKSTFTVSHIIDAWMTSPYGRGHDELPMFDTETPYSSIRPVRQALTAFAIQSTGTFLGSESKGAVKPDGGLHAVVSNEHMSVLAADEDERVDDDGVVAHCLSMLDFCKNDRARILPLCRGILYLSSCVPVDIIAINSRLGNMPSVNTIKQALRGFSQQKAVVIRTRGRNVAITRHADGRLTKRAKVLIFDNVQHFLRQRDLRIGRENSMIIGIAGTFFEIIVDAAALDFLDKRRRITCSRRPHITVDDLFNMIDQPHLKLVGIIQFVEALVNYIEEAGIYKKDVYLVYSTRLAKLQALVEKMQISPLATSGKNEAAIAELKDGLLDFLEQLGQTESDYDKQLWFGGGDGMSFNNMGLLKKYLQNHEDPFQSFELLCPVLQIWHTLWKNLGRICETHWGAPLNDNPATLGFSAKKIGRATPANLKKVDYYPTAQFVALVHDMKMLDCWARIHFETEDIFKYFSELKRTNMLPSFEELLEIAKTLFETYTAPGAQHQVRLDARDDAVAWRAHAPLGAPWQSLPSSSAPPPTKKKRSSRKTPGTPKTTKKPAKPKKPLPPPPPFFGDATLSDDGCFMHDAFIFREAVAATAQGNVGRVWEALKSMIFTFAGSTHGKYTNYLLEMVCDLELESSPALRDASLLSTVLNATGGPGDFSACDIYQELLNRSIDPIVQRKDADYGANHVREIWSRNIKDISDLKKEFRSGVGLAARSGKHKKPHERPEVKTLLSAYHTTELHKRRPGRTFNDGRDADNFQAGVKALQDGALSKWAKRTTNSRIHRVQSQNSSELVEDSEHESDWSDDDDDDEAVPMTAGSIRFVDGQLVFDVGEDGDDDFDIVTAMAMEAADDDAMDDE
ncbi:hypothetical protein C8R43DRAFT_897578 [Mycena crocata]|nr:hypothetical protein C8R43DRAFT_897578 [Mycena crocata]